MRLITNIDLIGRTERIKKKKKKNGRTEISSPKYHIG